jgi:hypothetical protein
MVNSLANQERAEAILEAVYAVPGVSSARVWFVEGSRVSVGVRGAGDSAPSELLRRVQNALIGLRDLEEEWDFGILADD